MEQICDFLQLPFEENLLDPYATCRQINGPGDYDIFQHNKIDPHLGETWQNIHLPFRLQFESSVLANYFQYQLPHN